ncbi:MAG: hypothetical protein ACE5KE_15385 [Methanosarcinales archaeon]
MSEVLLKSYDMQKIADAKRFAKRTGNYYLEDLIEHFIMESDPEHQMVLYEAIVTDTENCKKIWNFKEFH